MSKSESAKMYLLALICLMVAGCGGGGGSSSGAGGGGNTNVVATYQISGSVTSAGKPLPGVKLMLDGTTIAPVFTNTSGNYVFARVANGHYTVVPTMPGYRCTPQTSTQIVSGASISQVNFRESMISPVFYVADDSGTLGTVDISSGAVNLIGSTGEVMFDIAMDSNGTLYGITLDKLYKIDKTNANATLIGDLNIVDATSLVFDPDGQLYTADYQVHTVNIANGSTVALNAIGMSYQSSGDLAFLGNQLYLTSKIPITATDFSDAVDTNLLKLNLSTGAAVLVGTIGFPKVYGLATNDDVHLYGFSDTKVIAIDPATATGTLLFDFSGKGLSTINGATSQ